MSDSGRLAASLAALRSKQLFFLCGAPKSGTTWMQLLLDSHPNVVCSGEGHFCDQLLPRLIDAFNHYNGIVDGKNKTIFSDLRGYPLFRTEHVLYLLATAIALTLGEQAADAATLAVGEKTPDNGHHLPVLAVLFPHAKFIHVIRDGRDCAVSCWFHNQRLTPDWLAQTFPTQDDFFTEYARDWVKYLRAGQEFAAKEPHRYREIRYEDVLADTPREAARLFAFLGVPATDDVVRACCAGTSFESLSRGRTRGEEDRGSFFRRGIAGDWRSHMSGAAAEGFERIAGEWLSRYGYTDGDPGIRARASA
ncbi:MAG TPA: sulfotransferase [Stellaceae bacterium]|nr:sulfotransferase [Stellaceae bacterium]